MHPTRIALPILALLLVACATGSTRAAGSAATASSSASSTDQNRLTRNEITSANLPTAYDLVDRLRRAWLRPDAVTGGDVVVYMDDQNIGGPDKLRDIPSVEVAELRYLPNAEAVRRWGSVVTGSVIVVARRR